MGWSIGFDTTWNRDIGYGVPAKCDEPGCRALIDRGLSWVCCHEQPYGGDNGCGLYFCSRHIERGGKCIRCTNGEEACDPSPDTQEWIDFKNTDPSWEKWRLEQQEKPMAQCGLLERDLIQLANYLEGSAVSIQGALTAVLGDRSGLFSDVGRLKLLYKELEDYITICYECQWWQSHDDSYLIHGKLYCYTCAKGRVDYVI